MKRMKCRFCNRNTRAKYSICYRCKERGAHLLRRQAEVSCTEDIKNAELKRMFTRYMELKHKLFELDHDCHAGPEDGCKCSDDQQEFEDLEQKLFKMKVEIL